MEFDNTQGATPLDPNEINGLIPSHITTRSELDRWEQDNINEALAWLDKRRPKDILSESFMRELHKKMFCHVWQWAGKLRQTEKNLGILSPSLQQIGQTFSPCLNLSDPERET